MKEDSNESIDLILDLLMKIKEQNAPKRKKKLIKEVLDEQGIPAGTRAQFRAVKISSSPLEEKDVKVSTENSVEIPVRDTAGNTFQAIALERHELEMIKFASQYIKEAKAGNCLEGYRTYFKDGVLPAPNLKMVITYMKG